MERTARPALLCVFALIGTLLAGCLPNVGWLAERAAEEAAPATTEQTLAELDKAETQQRLRQVMDDPAWGMLAERFGYGLSEGITRQLATGSTEERVLALADVAAQQMATALEQRLGPALEQLAAGMVDASLDQALSEPTRARVEAWVRELTRAAVAAFAGELREGIRSAIAPAIAEALQDPELRAAAGSFSRMLARESLLGAQQGFQEVMEQAEGQGVATGPAGLLGFFERMMVLAKRGQFIIAMILAALAILLVIQIFWVRQVVRNARELRARAEWQDRILEVLAGRKSTPESAADAELLGRLSDQVREDPGRRERLRELLDQWQQGPPGEPA